MMYLIKVTFDGITDVYEDVSLSRAMAMYNLYRGFGDCEKAELYLYNKGVETLLESSAKTFGVF